MLMVWDPMSHRATVDIDLLAKTSNSIANLQKIINNVCAIEVILDGLKFASETLKLAEAQLKAEAPFIPFLESFYDNQIKKDKWNAFLRDISHELIPLEKIVGRGINYGDF
jgi:hypothetical protein